MTSVAHGELATPDAVPDEGEETVVVAIADTFRVEQILGGRLDGPQDYDQDHDEWALLLTGSAVLAVGGVEHHLAVGDWWLLPAGTPHRLLWAEPGTSWLVVRSATR